mgnify:FL=1
MLSGHDISDGGLITTLLEMSFGGVIGIDVNVTHKTTDPISTLFSEEVGWVLEVDNENNGYVLNEFKMANVPCYVVGRTCGFGMNSPVIIININKKKNLIIMIIVLLINFNLH